MIKKNTNSDLQAILKKENVDAILVTHVPTIIYLTNFSNFSTEERDAFLLITKDTNYIITHALYSEAVKKDVRNFTLIELSARSPLSEILKNLYTSHSLNVVGFEPYNLTVTEYKNIKKSFPKMKPISLADLRIIKENAEIDQIQKACTLGDEVFEHILPQIVSGITEKELAFEIEFYIKEQGHDISFRPIVAFGKNAAVPHHQTSNQPLESSNQFILFDFGAKVNNYCSDMTRTVFFGKANAEQKKMYNTVLESQKKAIEYINQHRHSGKRGTSASRINKNRSWTSQDDIRAQDVDKVARDYIVAQGYPSIPHSLGHGTGIEVHEAPNLSPKSQYELKEGMVFSIEPGIYIPGEAGVRIEDLITLTKSGVQILTKSPRELIEI